MENESRKEFSNAERADYMRRLMRIEQTNAKENMSAGGGSGDSGRQKSDNPIRADEEVASMCRILHPLKQEMLSQNSLASLTTKEIAIVDHKDLILPEDF